MMAAATALLAGDGYHCISMRTLATATSRSVVPIHSHCGSTFDRYRAVLGRLVKREHVFIIDALVDLSLPYLELRRFWLQRWLQQDDSLATIEVEVSLPLSTLALDLWQRAQTASAIAPAVPNLRLIIHSLTWILSGYVIGGPLDPAGIRLDLADPARVAAFKQLLPLYAQ